MVKSGFPWLTIRERVEMRHYRPSFVEPDRPNASAVLVRTPTGETFDVIDPALAAELGAGVRLIKQDRGVFDTMPLSLITTQAIAHLGALVDATLDVQRRPARRLLLARRRRHALRRNTERWRISNHPARLQWGNRAKVASCCSPSSACWRASGPDRRATRISDA